MATEADNGSIVLQDLKEAAEEAGIGWEKYVAAMAGDSDAATASIAEIDAAIAELDKTLDHPTRNTRVGPEQVQMQQQKNALEDLATEIRDTNGLIDDGSQNYQDYEAAVDASSAALAAEETAQNAAREALEERISAQQEAIGISRDAVSAEIDYRAGLDDMRAKLADTADTWDVATAEGRENLGVLVSGSDAVLQYADAIAKQTGDQSTANAIIAEGRQQLIDAATANGMAADEAAAYADRLGLIPREVSTTAVADTTAAQGALDALGNPIDVPVTADVGVAIGTLDDAVAPREAPVEATPEGVPQVAGQLDDLAEPREVEVKPVLRGQDGVRRDLDTLTKRRVVDVDVRFDQGQAQARLNSLVRGLVPSAITIPAEIGVRRPA